MKRDTMVGDLISALLAGWLFLSPWIVGFTNLTAAAWSAWIGALVVGGVAISALWSVTRAKEAINLVTGLLLIASPWLLHFATELKPASAVFQPGIVFVTVAVLELYVMRKPAPAATA
jgi:hypothetical protein